MTKRRTSEEVDAIRASLVAAAKVLVQRDGANALTMRAVAAEAGCAVGLPYKFFANRDELVLELVTAELTELTSALTSWLQTSGRRSVGANLERYAAILLDSETPALLGANAIDDEALEARVRKMTQESGLTHSFDEAIAAYLGAEQEQGRVRPDVDVRAFGFLIAGAIHNLVVAGELYPRPSRRELRRFLDECAAAIAPARGR
ncbi:TetR/AcrR family transcriptional regulator [Kribbella sp. NPDC048915]|uniref:TetR/AcrR family transcriptional regulator n=1 Tax=Kribbella sp. NPDC048915 TaxID=3155148 RepID=UPI0033C376E9